VTVFIVLDAHGRELLSTPAVEIATWSMNRLDGAASVVTDDGTLIATRHKIEGASVAAWLVRLGWINA